MNELIAYEPLTINKRVLNLVGGQEVWDKIMLLYREAIYKRNGTTTPQLLTIFRKAGLTDDIYEQVVGLVGNTDTLHKTLNRPTPLELNNLTAMVNELAQELRNRIPKMDNKELIALAKELPNITGNTQPGTQININQDFNIQKHLERRGISVLEVKEQP